MLVVTDAPNIKKCLKYLATDLSSNFQLHIILWHDNLNVARC
jgi:hypothetical protein